MRYHLRPSLSVLGMLLALLIPSLLVVEAAHSNPSAPPDRVTPGDISQSPSGVGGDAPARVMRNYGLLPLSFEANRGQADPSVRFLARNSAYSLYLTADGITLSLRHTGANAGTQRRAGRDATGAVSTSALRIRLLGASREPHAYGMGELAGKGNYLFASLPADGTYTVTPQATAVYAFSPGGASFNTLPSNQTANFAAARLLYQVSGYALDACGRAISGVNVSLTHDGVTATAQTNASGFYTFAGVQAGYSYTLAPTGSAYTFTPPSVAFPGPSANQSATFTGSPPVTATNVPALADLYVRGGSATSNFGTATQLITRLANQTKDTHESYLKFNVGQPCTVASVKLRVYGQLSGSGNIPVAVYGVPVTTWTETGTTWNNKPAAGAPLRTVNIPGTTAAWYEWDVTDYVRGELAAGRGTVSFALKSTAATSYQVTFNSREAAGSNAPRLVVTTP